MNKKVDQLSLPSDLYSRNVHIAEGIRQYKKLKGLRRIKILDVGGRGGQLNVFLDPEDHLTILDIREGGESNLIVGDGTQMTMFEDHSFDVVVSGDTYEHIPFDLRKAFILESFRVSADLVILAAPFDEPGVHEAETMLNHFFQSLLGEDHEWLKEHLEYGLPEKALLEDLIRSHGRQFFILSSSDLDNWVLLQMLIFFSYCYGVSDDLIQAFYQAYNRDFLEVEDFRLGSYRQIFFMTREVFPFAFSYQLDPVKRSSLRSAAFDLISTFTRHKNTLLQGQLDLNVQQVAQVESLRHELVSVRDLNREFQTQLSEHVGALDTLKVVIQSQEDRFSSTSVELYRRQEVIQELTIQVQNRDQVVMEKESQLQELNSDLKMKGEQVGSLEYDLGLHREELDHLRVKLEERRQVCRELKYHIGILRKRSLGKQYQVRFLQAKLIREESRSLKLEDEISGLNESLRDLNERISQKDQQIQELLPDYQEFQVVKRSLSYRFLLFHRGITGYFVKLYRSGLQGFHILRRDGVRVFFFHLKQYFISRHRSAASGQALSLNEQYQIFLEQERSAPRPASLSHQIQDLRYQPLISLLTPVYNVAPRWLDRCIQSVMDQSYPHWEMCLYDDASTDRKTLDCLKRWEGRDPRIKISFGQQNLHISGASNHSLQMATGEFVALLDNDDEISPNALLEVVKRLNDDPDLDMLYSDEDKLDLQGNRIDPHFKPDWSPETFESMMYCCHLGVYRRSLLEKIGGFRVGFEGSQDYDLVLRFTDHTDRIAHIPQILYHWRMIPGSTAASANAKDYAYEAAQKALLDRLLREHQDGRVQQSLWKGSYRVRRLLEEKPLVSIIIPFRDQPEYLERCLESLEKSSYPHREILLISNQSQMKETQLVVDRFCQQNQRIRSFDYPREFNFSAINNWAVQRTHGDFLLFLNNDTELISKDWIESLLELAVRMDIGAVGAKLLYPDNTIQHAGVVLGVNGVANHAFRHVPAEQHGYFGYANVVRNYSAVTAACMMLEKRKFFEVGGFDEQHLAVAYNDVDLCLKLLRRGYRNVYTPFAQLYHHESVSRGKDALHHPRFQEEAEYMMEVWGDLIRNDPYYNPHLTLEREDFSLRI